MADRCLEPEQAVAALPARRHELQLMGAGALLIAVCYGLARYAYGFFVPVFRTEFGLDGAAVGLIAAGSYAAYCVAIVIATMLIPRIGARTVAVAAGCLAVSGVLMVALAPNTLVLAAGVLIAGSSTGVASPPLADAVARTANTSARDRMQTVINAAAGLGLAVAGAIALLTQAHWRAAWMSFAVVGAASVLWVAFAVPGATHRAARPDPMSGLLPRPLLPAGAGRLMAAAALLGAASSAVWTFGRDVLVTIGGMDEWASTIAWTLLGAAGLFGAAAGDLARRFGIATGWVAGMLALGVATLLLAAFPSLRIVAWLSAAVFGAVYMIVTGLLLIWGTQVYAAAPGAGVGLAFLALSLGQGSAAPLIGGLLEGFGPGPAFAAAAVVACVAALARPAHLAGLVTARKA
jgi:predicted MFS family arabinose efflux permease